ncbi:MAG: hypothetical protein CMJ28_00925, partial [Phycisphaerae bacterium]|nr:hypothetical protein [Phycisphaerae bacterium]
MNDLRTIAWREFRETALTPAFLISLVGMPLLLVVVAVLSSGMALTHTEPPVEGCIWIESNENFRNAFAERVKQGVQAQSVGDMPSVLVDFDVEIKSGSRVDPPNKQHPAKISVPDSV